MSGVAFMFGVANREIADRSAVKSWLFMTAASAGEPDQVFVTWPASPSQEIVTVWVVSGCAATAGTTPVDNKAATAAQPPTSLEITLTAASRMA
jgi:hypothetical protein